MMKKAVLVAAIAIAVSASSLQVPAAAASMAAAAASRVSLKRRLQTGGKSYGPFLISDSPVLAELLSLTGYGHIVVDHEHSPTDLRSGQTILTAIQAAAAVSTMPVRTEPIVRLPGFDAVYMKQVLDSLPLPGGVLVPMIEDAATARAVVASTRYPKQQPKTTTTAEGKDDDDIDGMRGCAVPFIRASQYGFHTNTYLNQCQEDLLVMVQVETVKGVKHIPEIAAIPGIDAIFLGPFDLSTSFGKMGLFTDPDVIQLLKNAEQAVLEQPQCLLAGFKIPGRSLSDMFDAGYSFVCGSVDLGLLKAAAVQDAEAGTAAIEKYNSKTKTTTPGVTGSYLTSVGKRA